MLTERQQEIFDQFRESTHANKHLDGRDEVLVGLAAAMALDCKPCMRFYASRAKEAGISRDTISEVLAKVMLVAANKKQLQVKEVLAHYFEKSLLK